MDKKRIIFYGTPLNQCSQDDPADNVGPVQRRRARLNNLQSVRDDQGRKRFHGAFTGGFSAGYFNTVDTKEGFQPKSFISRRNEGESQSKFSHKPEDYMDEEDFGEFGIAPKKVRLAAGYSSSKETLLYPSKHAPNSAHLLKPAASIGEKILKRSIGPTCRSELTSTSPSLEYYLDHEKHNYHGLGYSPLRPNESSRVEMPTSAKPLEASFKDGRRLKISGSAFGSGLNDDDDLNDDDFAYNHDDESNYDFARIRREPRDSATSSLTKSDQNDPFSLSTFVLHKRPQNLNLEEKEEKYPLPNIDKDWQMPCKMIDLTEPPAMLNQLVQPSTADLLARNSSQLLCNKFTSSISKVKTSVLATMDTLGKKSGLMSYNDIMAESNRVDASVDLKNRTAATIHEPTISRKEFEWRPCSLLCRHFNVPNPFPDNAFFGTKHIDFSCDNTSQPVKEIEIEADDLPLEELRQTIFNAFDSGTSVEEAVHQEDNYEDDEDEPQVVVFDASTNSADCSLGAQVQTGNDDPDIEVLGVPVKEEPVVITLSSSDTSRESSCSRNGDADSRSNTTPRLQEVDRSDSREKDDCDHDDDDDAYGPPLPPSLRALHGTEASGYRYSRSPSRSSSSSRSRRRHRYKSGRRESKHRASERVVLSGRERIGDDRSR